jgi:hypothetical protein
MSADVKRQISVQFIDFINIFGYCWMSSDVAGGVLGARGRVDKNSFRLFLPLWGAFRKQASKLCSKQSL